MVIKVAFLIPDYSPVEFKRRADAALAYSSDEVEVGVLHVEGLPKLAGFSPTERQLVAPMFIEAFRSAERQGFDAVVPLGTLDLGVEGGRSAVDIPVIAPSEAMLHIASLLGKRFGAIVYHESILSLVESVVSSYGMDHKICGWRCSGFERKQIADNRDSMVANFIAQARELIDQEGAQVILPFGISQCPLHIDPNWLSEQIGVPVVEGIGAPIRMAALLAGLKLKHSRVRWPRSPTFPSESK